MLVILVNIITEVVKNLFDFKTTHAINLFVTVLSILLTVGGFITYFQINAINITWYLIVAFVIVGFLVAYAAMFGYDKLLKYFEDVKG